MEIGLLPVPWYIEGSRPIISLMSDVFQTVLELSYPNVQCLFPGCSDTFRAALAIPLMGSALHACACNNNM